MGFVAAALACAVDDRPAPGVSEGAAEPGESDQVAGGLGGSSNPGGGVGGSGSGGSSGSDGSGSAAGGVDGSGNVGGSGAGGAGAGGPGSGGNVAGGSGGSTASGGSGGVAVTPSALCGEQLLANGDFDLGRTGWEETWEVRETVVSRTDPLLVEAGVTPQSGDYVAWLGGIDNGEFGEKYFSRITAMVTIPEDTVSLTFSGYIWVQQPELGVTPTSDWAVLEFLDPLVTEGYDNLWQIDTWGDADVSAGWVAFEYVQTNQMDRFRGRTLPIMADSRPDGNGTLSVFLDSLRLEARCE